MTFNESFVIFRFRSLSKTAGWKRRNDNSNVAERHLTHRIIDRDSALLAEICVGPPIAPFDLGMSPLVDQMNGRT